MTVDEFDVRFDILYNNIASNAAVPLDAYEKSVFLSQAQKDIIIELYNGRNALGLSFESTEEARAYLRNLTKSLAFPASSASTGEDYVEYTLDNKVWFITYEEVTTSNSTSPIVIPIKQDTIHEIMRNPFKKPSNDRVLRVDIGNKIRLYGDGISEYTIFYLEKPSPIILNNINDRTLTIDEVPCDTSNEGSSPEILHNLILERAVALAKKAYNQ